MRTPLVGPTGGSPKRQKQLALGAGGNQSHRSKRREKRAENHQKGKKEPKNIREKAAGAEKRGQPFRR